MHRIRFLAFCSSLLLALAFGHIALAQTPDFSGNWEGSWYSNWDSDSGGLSATIYQAGTSLSGTVSVRGTDCPVDPDFLDLPIHAGASVVGDRASFRVSSYCDVYYVEVSITNATVSGNTMSGNYETLLDGDTDDQGTFILDRSTYTIVASARTGGTISPSGSVSVNAGADQVFTITPNTGYIILDVEVDGSSVGAVPSYTFTNVQSNYTLVASFDLDGSTCEILTSEGFEEGTMPPSGWTLIKTNPDNTWIITNALQHTGTYSAGVNWDSANQDEVLLTPVLPMTSARLRFWSAGSLYWCRDDHDNCDLEIWIVVGSWDDGAGDDIFVGKADDDWPADFEWALTIFELTQQLPGKPVRIGFRYKGLDGDAIVIDDIQICYERAAFGMPWMPMLLLQD